MRERKGVARQILLDFDVEKIRREKEEALEAHDFDTAAPLRARERELAQKAWGRYDPGFGEEEAIGASAVYGPSGLRSQVPTFVPRSRRPAT